jgi:hypothetical protein
LPFALYLLGVFSYSPFPLLKAYIFYSLHLGYSTKWDLSYF